ncbi:MAG: DUF6551 family protein [Candidatus Xenobiia bacterium LiM19]
MISLKMVQKAKTILFDDMAKKGLSHLMKVKISDIFFDDYYRNEDTRHTKNLTDNYKEGVWDYPRLNHRDNRHYCYSGRHRIAAAKSIGEEEVECIVFEGQTKEWEIDQYRAADIFRKRHTQKDDFKAALVTGDKDALFINEIASGYGFSVLGGSGKSRIGCIGALKKIVNSPGGEDLFRDILNVVMVWHGKQGSLYEAMIKGMGKFLVIAQKQHIFNIGHLKEKIISIDPKEILDNAKIMPIVEQLAKIYNEGLSLSKQLNRKNFVE